MAWLSANWFLAVLELCVTGAEHGPGLRTDRAHLDTHAHFKYIGTCPQAVRKSVQCVGECVCVLCMCVRNPFNNLTQTDPDLTPSGSTKPLNPLISPPNIPKSSTHTHPPSYITLRNLSGSSRLSVAFLSPFLLHPSNILSVGKAAVIAEVGSLLPAPTQHSKRPCRHVKAEIMCESTLNESPYMGYIFLPNSLFIFKKYIWSVWTYFVSVMPLFHSLASVFYLYLLRVTLYDYQALCWAFSESSDSGHTLLDVSTALFSNLCAPCDATWAQHNMSFLCLIHISSFFSFFSRTLLSSQL